jgi:hypothetical protein
MVDIFKGSDIKKIKESGKVVVLELCNHFWDRLCMCLCVLHSYQKVYFCLYKADSDSLGNLNNYALQVDFKISQ